MDRQFSNILILLVLILSIVIFTGSVSARVECYFNLGQRIMQRGDEGPDVALLQRKLQQLNYYRASIDGLYGPGTARAVRAFQRDNNITIDGVVGPETLSKLPEENLLDRMNFSRDEIILLARIIHGEARGETFRGKVAVGAVVLNRVYSREFPDSVREVILQRGQFTSLSDGQANYYPLESSLDAARAALIGYDPTYAALYFYNPEVATKLSWISGRPVTTKIGAHIFAI